MTLVVGQQLEPGVYQINEHHETRTFILVIERLDKKSIYRRATHEKIRIPLNRIRFPAGLDYKSKPFEWPTKEAKEDLFFCGRPQKITSSR